MEATFPWPGRACPSVSGLRSSSRGQGVLGGCSPGVYPLQRAGRHARVGKAPEVVSFPRVVRPALWDGRWPQVRCTHGRGGGGCTGKHYSLLAGRQVSLLGHKEYSMEAHPSSSHLSNTGALSLLQV